MTGVWHPGRAHPWRSRPVDADRARRFPECRWEPVAGAERVCADIWNLDQHRTFDAVVVEGTPDEPSRPVGAAVRARQPGPRPAPRRRADDGDPMPRCPGASMAGLLGCSDGGRMSRATDSNGAGGDRPDHTHRHDEEPEAGDHAEEQRDEADQPCRSAHPGQGDQP